MKTPASPVVALALAGLWCLAQAADAPRLAAAVAVAALAAASATALRRRGTRRLAQNKLKDALKNRSEQGVHPPGHARAVDY